MVVSNQEPQFAFLPSPVECGADRALAQPDRQKAVGLWGAGPISGWASTHAGVTISPGQQSGRFIQDEQRDGQARIIVGEFEITRYVAHLRDAQGTALAGKLLKDFGYDKVYNLGGFKDWVEAGGKVEK